MIDEAGDALRVRLGSAGDEHDSALPELVTEELRQAGPGSNRGIANPQRRVKAIALRDRGSSARWLITAMDNGLD